MGGTESAGNTRRQVESFGDGVVEEVCDSFQVVELLEEQNCRAEKKRNDGTDEFHENVLPVDDDDHDHDHEPEVVRDRALELVALRLRRIGDEMDEDIRTGSPMTSQRRRNATGYAVDMPSVFLDLFPVPRDGLIGDLAACETLLRDLAHVTVGDVMVTAWRELTRSALYELVTCPVYFRSKWSFDGHVIMNRSADHLDSLSGCSTATDLEINEL